MMQLSDSSDSTPDAHHALQHALHNIDTAWSRKTPKFFTSAHPRNFPPPSPVYRDAADNTHYSVNSCDLTVYPICHWVILILQVPDILLGFTISAPIEYREWHKTDSYLETLFPTGF